MNKHFMGQDQFIWAVGVVEDRSDPLKLGRCRVRMVGIHSEDKSKLPTEHLPWAMPILPINSASVSGMGASPTGPVEGTWVFCMFRDGQNMQDPIMLGVIPGKPEEEKDSNKGLNDPRTEKLASKKIPSYAMTRKLVKRNLGENVKGASTVETIAKTAAGLKPSRAKAQQVAKSLISKQSPVSKTTQAIVDKIISKEANFKTDGLTSAQVKEEQLVQALTSGFLPIDRQSVYQGKEPVIAKAKENTKKIQEILKAGNDIQAKKDIGQIIRAIDGLEELTGIGSVHEIGSTTQVSGILSKLSRGFFNSVQSHSKSSGACSYSSRPRTSNFGLTLSVSSPILDRFGITLENKKFLNISNVAVLS